jgi:hypothetical protein
MSEKTYTQKELEAMLETTYADAYAKGKANGTKDATPEAKEGFLKGFNWKQNTLSAVVAAGAAAAGMYFLKGSCSCDIPNAE